MGEARHDAYNEAVKWLRRASENRVRPVARAFPYRARPGALLYFDIVGMGLFVLVATALFYVGFKGAGKIQAGQANIFLAGVTALTVGGSWSYSVARANEDALYKAHAELKAAWSKMEVATSRATQYLTFNQHVLDFEKCVALEKALPDPLLAPDADRPSRHLDNWRRKAYTNGQKALTEALPGTMKEQERRVYMEKVSAALCDAKVAIGAMRAAATRYPYLQSAAERLDRYFSIYQVFALNDPFESVADLSVRRRAYFNLSREMLEFIGRSIYRKGHFNSEYGSMEFVYDGQSRRPSLNSIKVKARSRLACKKLGADAFVWIAVGAHVGQSIVDDHGDCQESFVGKRRARACGREPGLCSVESGSSRSGWLERLEADIPADPCYRHRWWSPTIKFPPNAEARFNHDKDELPNFVESAISTELA